MRPCLDTYKVLDVRCGKNGGNEWNYSLSTEHTLGVMVNANLTKGDNFQTKEKCGTIE